MRGDDLPGGLQRCSQSGNVDAYLASVKAARPDLYPAQADEWNALKGQGATDAWFAVYAQDSAQCAAMFGTGGGQFQNPKFVQNLVFRFKDSASAASAYKNGIFGLTAGAIAGQPGVTQGSATGLGGNSVLVTRNTQGSTAFLAFWQRDVFAVLFRSSNLADADAKNAVLAVNNRI